MVFELLVSPHKARREPWDLFLLSFLFVSLGVGFRLVFPGLDGSAVVFAMVPAIPLIWTLLMREEKADEEFFRHNKSFFHYHGTLIEIFGFFFLGAVVAYSVWYAALPTDVSKEVFSSQIKEIGLVQQAVSTGMAFKQGMFEFLFSHNLQVLALMFAFSFLYGIGSVYLLLWNASVIGVFIGSKVHAEGALGVLNAFFGLLPHGSLEILAYFIASIAGGILSVAISRRRWAHPEFKLVMLDVATLAVVAVVILAIGALVEAAY